MIFENNPLFWQRFDLMLLTNEIEIKHPKGSMVARYGNIPLPLDLGILNLESIEGKNRWVEIFVGENFNYRIDGVILIFNGLTCKMETKIIAGCGLKEIRDLGTVLNHGDYLKSLIIAREKEVESIVGEINDKNDFGD